jgi:hypothetical protein
VVALLPEDVLLRSCRKAPGLGIGGEREPGGEPRHRALDEVADKKVGDGEVGDLPDADHPDGVAVPPPAGPGPGEEEGEHGGEL